MVKQICKYGTGQIVPNEAIYLSSVTNGDFPNKTEGYPENYKYVWHYFLVEVKE